MKADVKAAWLEALRSGEYEQGRGTLHQEDTFCCLGVLCDLAVKAEVVDPWVDDDPEGAGISVDRHSPGEREISTLPPDVMEWAGVENDNPRVWRMAVPWALAELNDSGATFAELADLIERDL